MKKLTLHHSLTFPELDANNEALCGLLCDQEPDTERLRRLVAERDQLILSHLESLSEPDKKCFAEAELACNKQILALVQPLFDETEASLTSFLRSRKAIRNYQK